MPRSRGGHNRILLGWVGFYVWPSSCATPSLEPSGDLLQAFLSCSENTPVAPDTPWVGLSWVRSCRVCNRWRARAPRTERLAQWALPFNGRCFTFGSHKVLGVSAAAVRASSWARPWDGSGGAMDLPQLRHSKKQTLPRYSVLRRKVRRDGSLFVFSSILESILRIFPSPPPYCR